MQESGLSTVATIFISIFLLGVGIIILGLTGIVDLSYPRVVNPTPTLQESSLSPEPTITSQPIIEGWETFFSEEMGFSVQHPPEMNVNKMTNSVVMTIQGPTQKVNTEFYDGISLSFSSGSLNGMSLIELAEEEVDRFGEDPAVEEVGDIRFVTINDISGYSFDITGLGTRTYIYLLQTQTKFLQIINATVDPTGQGFEGVVNTMFSTLKV